MKKIARAIISMGVVLAFAGCSWEVPQNVSVKTKADYNFSLGTFTKELDNNMDLTSMLGQTGEGNDSIATYDYFPGKEDKNTQHFLLEVKILDQKLLSTVPDAAALDLLFSNGDEIDITGLSTFGVPLTAIPANAVSLDFNPATMLAGMKEALGEDLAGKISFASIPMYLYCQTAEKLETTAALSIYYGDDPENDPTHHRAGVEGITLLPSENGDNTLKNVPKPTYEKDGETVVSKLSDYDKNPCIGNQAIKLETLLSDTNTAIQDGDKLCISYQISVPSGSITRADVEAGIPLALYAVIDLPVEFKVLQNVKLDVNELTKKAEGESGSSGEGSSSGNSSGDKSSDNEEFKKYLEAIDSVTIRYVAYQLPFYSRSGMKLGFDLVGDGSYQYADIKVTDKGKKIAEKDKPYITLHQATIMKMKDISSLNPKIQLLMEKDSKFSLPRTKAIEMDLGITLSTDGNIKVN